MLCYTILNTPSCVCKCDHDARVHRAIAMLSRVLCVWYRCIKGEVGVRRSLSIRIELVWPQRSTRVSSSQPTPPTTQITTLFGSPPRWPQPARWLDAVQLRPFSCFCGQVNARVHSTLFPPRSHLHTFARC